MSSFCGVENLKALLGEIPYHKHLIFRARVAERIEEESLREFSEISKASQCAARLRWGDPVSWFVGEHKEEVLQLLWGCAIEAANAENA